MLFNFHLLQLNKIRPWEHNNQKYLNWFGLTDGWYWMDVETDELFRYTDDIVSSWDKELGTQAEFSYVDYQVVRFWEDLLDMLPNILEPIPTNILQKINLGTDMLDYRKKVFDYLFIQDNGDLSENSFDTLEITTSWIDKRLLPTSHLLHSPFIWFWNDGKNMFIHWDNRSVFKDNIQVWKANFGTYSISIQQFIDELRLFDKNLMNAIQLRINEIREGWKHSEIEINISEIERQQNERSKWLEQSFVKAHLQKSPKWDEIQAMLEKIS